MNHVHTRRFELPHPKRIPAPQAGASTNSATCANEQYLNSFYENLRVFDSMRITKILRDQIVLFQLI